VAPKDLAESRIDPGHHVTRQLFPRSAPGALAGTRQLIRFFIKHLFLNIYLANGVWHDFRIYISEIGATASFEGPRKG
jgi:hypothetical protein